ncbi:hypothetical protein SCHPADRAFT_995437 [Schizopora paradoxa]|uniref:F-box domain-containing protein n=1 Tax=Schizopora paradoxa TaxID=27342 RepID=A0A0H2RVB2_9AGAM|nr:hypothetical protein SCHPADRAFT_995437 [Schizopora paradoxa]
MAQNILPDVLFEIFQRCVPSDMSDVSLTTSPFNLSRVCRSWRHLALERTSLWATMKLQHDGVRFVHLARTKRAWKLWLRRSAAASLTAGIYSDRILDGDDNDAFAEIVEMTFAEQHRWKDISIWCNSFTASPWRTLHLNASPHLEFLQLRNQIPLFALPGCSRNEISIDISEQAHTMHTLSLGGAIYLSPSVGLLPNLHTIYIQAHCASPRSSALTIQDFFKFILSAPNLTRIYASLISTTSEIDFLPTVTLPHLRHLQLSIYGFLEHLLGALTCPTLEELYISFLDEVSKSREIWDAVIDMLSRSRPPLRYLTLDSSASHYSGSLRREDQILLILRYTPDLRSMSIRGQYLTDKFIDALNLHSESEVLTGNLCPNLESITIVCKGEHNITAEGVKDMICSRICDRKGEGTDKHLRKVVLDLKDFEYPPLVEFCSKGGVKLITSK